MTKTPPSEQPQPRPWVPPIPTKKSPTLSCPSSTTARDRSGSPPPRHTSTPPRLLTPPTSEADRHRNIPQARQRRIKTHVESARIPHFPLAVADACFFITN